MSKPSDTPTAGVSTPAEAQPERSTARSELGPRDEPSSGELGRAREAIRGRMFPEMQAELDGRYRLQGVIGRGGLGHVYKAYDTKLQRNVAIKFLRSASGAPESASALEREAQVLAQLQHPNIVAVHDVGRSQDELYLTMELIDGVSLAAWLTEKKRGWRDSIALLKQAAHGLAAAHEAGVVHRDFKPANVMVDRAGRVRVVDFGLAREVVWTQDEAVESLGGSGVVHTKAAGTPPYMAPEQFDGQVSAASDQFAFCTSAYEAVCGRRPWRGIERGIGDREDAQRIGQELRKSGVDGAVRRAIVRGLQLDPSDRFADIHGLLAALEPRRARWPWMTGGFAAVAVAVAGVAVVAQQQQQQPCVDRGTAAAALWPAAEAAALVGRIEDPEVARDVSARREAFVERWNAGDRRTCEAEVRGEVSPAVAALRVRCFERVGARVRSTLDRIAERPYEDDGIQRAIVSATSLQSCVDDDALLVGVPEEGYDASAGERIQRAIDAAFIYASLGDDGRWLSSLESIHASIEPRGAAPRDEVWLAQHLGGALIRRGRLQEAEEVLMPALLECKRHPGWVLQTSMLQVQLARLAIARGRADEAKLLISVAEPALSTLVEQQHACVAAITHAQIANASNRWREALEHLSRAEEIEAAAGDAAVGWAGIENIRSDRELTRCTALIGLRNFKEGEPLCREVLRSLEVAGREVSDARAAATNNLALAMRNLGRDADAVPLFRKAAALKERLGDVDGAGRTWANLGNTLEGSGDHIGGLLAYAEAERVLGDRRTVGAVSFRFNRGLSYAIAESWPEAIADYDEALDIAGELGERSPVDRYDIEVGLGVALATVGDSTRAERVLERALRHETERSDPYTQAELRVALVPLLDSDTRRAEIWADAKLAAAASGDTELIAATAN